MLPPLRLGILGVAHGHVQSFFEEVDQSRGAIGLVGIYDESRTCRERFICGQNVPVFDDPVALLDIAKPTVVAIAAQYHRRAKLAMLALMRDIPVAVDKPLATTRKDLAAVAEVARASKAPLSLVLEKRGYPVTLAALELARTGVLGQVVHVSASAPHKLDAARRPAWVFDPVRYGGVLGDLLTHDVDLALLFLATTRETTSGQVVAYTQRGAAPPLTEMEVFGAAMFTTDEGRGFTLDAHWLSAEAAPYHGDYRMQVVGTAGTADLLWKDNALVVATHDTPPFRPQLPAMQRPAADFFGVSELGKNQPSRHSNRSP